MKYIFISLLFISSFCSLAGESTYRCTIKQIMDLSDKGEIIKHSGVYKSSLGESFTINRISGEMDGSHFSTKSYRVKNILDKGSKEDSFKSIVTSKSPTDIYPPHMWAIYIQVEEYKEGKYKPFWSISGSNIFSGYCE